MIKRILQEEKKLWKKGYKIVVGLDEVGRGCLAGPVVAAAVALLVSDNKSTKKEIKNLKIKDSKKLTVGQREKFYKFFTSLPAIKWEIGKVSEKVIDKINIKNASELAMEKALNSLIKNNKINRKDIFLIIDGQYLKNSNLKRFNHKLVVKGDEMVFSCAVASILAKVTRDNIMNKHSIKYPEYKFKSHKGYPTREHLRIIEKYKLLPIYRKSFNPVIKVLER